MLLVTPCFCSDHLAIRVAHPQPVIHPPQYPTMSTFKPGPCPTTPTVSSHAPSISSSHGGPTHSMSTASLHSTMAALSSIREISPKWTATKALTITQLKKIANLATIPPYPSAYNATLTTLENHVISRCQLHRSNWIVILSRKNYSRAGFCILFCEYYCLWEEGLWKECSG